MKALLGIVDAQEMAKQHPDTFEVPSDQELKDLKPGDFVKICVGNERFWVEVTEAQAHSPVIDGRVDNNLERTSEHGLVYNDMIRFEKRHVYSVAPPAPEDVHPLLN